MNVIFEINQKKGDVTDGKDNGTKNIRGTSDRHSGGRSLRSVAGPRVLSRDHDPDRDQRFDFQITIKSLDKKEMVLVLSETETEDGTTYTYTTEATFKKI